MIECSFQFSSIFTCCITDVVAEVEDDDRPSAVDAFKGFSERGSREEDKCNYECSHDDEGVG